MAPSDDANEQAIHERAYLLCEHEGGPEGRAFSLIANRRWPYMPIRAGLDGRPGRNPSWPVTKDMPGG